MKDFLPESLKTLAGRCAMPLYLVGGSVRDFLMGRPVTDKTDWDICSPAREEEILSAARQAGFAVRAVYPHTGTVKLTGPDGCGYEFTRFRSDTYVRGLHSPAAISFTEDIGVDARRRDFCANAVYYSIREDVFCDPLGGMEDIRKKRLRTVAPAEKVFGEDGLRLMRLARIAAQTGFSPDEECLEGAGKHAALIRDIYPERIFSELTLLLQADERCGDEDAPYRGLKLLDGTGVLDFILPELTKGRGMAQNAAFHRYDVLEHSLRAVRYADPSVRFAALLHDVGKPYCMQNYGNFHGHEKEGGPIARDILTRLKAPKSLMNEVCALTALHMRDYNLLMRENKVRRTIVENYSLLGKLLLLKQADFSACTDDRTEAPCVTKWTDILKKMRSEGAPLRLKDLAVSGNDLLALGIPPAEVGECLEELLLFAAFDGTRNERDKLLSHAALRLG